MHVVAVLALDGVVAFDLATPVEVFGRACLPDGRAAYHVRICAPSPEIDAGAFSLRAPWGLETLAEADTIVVPGLADPLQVVPADALVALQTAYGRGTRIASICAGAFVLAATGLLDGLRATTHWLAAAELARRYPAVDVDPDVLFVDNGQVLTSAGAAAGLDLCLHMVRRDYGAAVAADAARLSVIPLERDGGQAQFILHAPPTPEGATLAPLLTWMDEHACEEDLTLERLALHALTSPRTLSRRFREQIGTTPLQWLIRARLRQAQYLLECTDQSIERIASLTGFGSSATLRAQFRQHIGTSPSAYRRAFQTTTRLSSTHRT